MVSELGLIYADGKHWTGSMIELRYGHHEFNFKKNRNWMDPVEESSFKCTSHFSNSRRDGQRGLLTNGLFMENFLESASRDMPNGIPKGNALPPSLARYILQLLKEKDGIRHSITSLLPSEMQEPFGYELWHRKARCRSCEPQTKSSQFGSATLSTFFFEHFFLNLQNRLTKSNTSPPPRKRLSLSDSEICYAKDLPEQTMEESLERITTVEIIPEVSEETTTLESSESLDSPEEPAKAPIFEAGTIEEDNGEELEENTECPVEPVAANPSTPTSEEPEEHLDPPVIKVSKKKKSVRFADDIGCVLCQEKLITDISLPPNLHLSFDDDFRDLGDDLLPGVVRPTFKALVPKTNSLPDIMKIPPPVPKLHHSSSSDETINLAMPKSPVTSPTTGYANWRITFAQPAAQYLAFRQRLDSKFVSLENITLTNRTENTNNLFIYGKAKVKNIAFEKRVKLRVTTDRWKSYKDYPAVYNVQTPTASSGNSLYDQFMFNFCVDVSQMPEPREVQFAVCFQAGQNGEIGEYWDNNDGCNYVIIEDVLSHPVGPYGSFQNRPPAGTEGSPMRAEVGGSEQNPPGTAYTSDYRPNFNSFSSLTYYSSWQHYSSESMYY